MTRSFEDLVAWQKAHEFVVCVYRATATFPQNESFGLTSQFRRAAVSIAANIAEGKDIRRLARLTNNASSIYLKEALKSADTTYDSLLT